MPIANCPAGVWEAPGKREPLSSDISIDLVTSLEGLDFGVMAELNALAWGSRVEGRDIDKRARKLHQRLAALDPAGRGVFLARDAGKLVGFCWMHRDTDDPACWWLVGLVVHPDFRMQGIGRALVGAAIGYARGQGAPLIRFQTHADNAASIAFHECLGFASDGHFTAPDGDQLVAFRMPLG